ncbi:CitMHS family transporter [Rothia terrae]|uniref:CitMHS family transporter n=1 Tax=Rothia terrae TaxID=396015 RepID=A0A7H2BE19_9MICC|nr:CitMHS family transporter [Rothia terrae]QNV37915.1 CitMHS family transporter [Rothia terrae]
MLVILGFTMILVFMTLIMTKKLSPILALIIVPTVFGLFAGAGMGIGDMVMDAIEDMSSTAALLLFAIIYFGIMIDVGLFDKLVEFIIKIVGNDPAKVVVGTAVLAGCVSLDGDGSTTFIVVTAALLPVYQRLSMSPVVLTCVAGLTNGTLNIVPWGGPTVRAASALKVDANSIFTPMVPSLIVGLLVVLAFSWHLGVMERRRLRASGNGPWQSDPALADIAPNQAAGSAAAYEPGPATQALTINQDSTEHNSFVGTALDPNRPTLRPKLFWFNLALTVAIMVLLIMDDLPLPYLFMMGTAIALIVNFRSLKEQADELASHSSAVISVVAMVMAAGVLTGVMTGTGMVDAMAQWLVDVIPTSWGPYLAVVTGVLSIPMTFFMSNDAFYFGILPVLAETASHYGIPAVDMARASITGQPVHLNSPLVPAILLLVSLAGVELGDHHKKVLWRGVIVSLVMLAVGVLTGVIMAG